MGYGLWQGAERATGRFNEVGLNLLANQRQEQQFQQRMDLEQARTKRQEASDKVQKYLGVMRIALNVPNKAGYEERFSALLPGVTPPEINNFEEKGNTVELKLANGIGLKGPKDGINKTIDFFSSNMGKMGGRQLAANAFRFAVQNGVSVSMPQPRKETPKDDILPLNGVAYQIKEDESGNKSLSQIGGEGTPKTKGQLTIAALRGDAEAKQIIDQMADKEVEMARRKGEASSEGKLAGLESVMDIEGTAKAIIEGRETIENVRNTFGVPIQERVRKEVLKKDPNFNFNQPRAAVKSLTASLQQQQKNRGMMGSFVKNINGQVDKLENISRDIVERVGVRAIDLPIREFKTRFIGSGNERVMEAYMKEVSAEIAKLAQGSAASVAQLPESNRQEWERIHDVNLSMRELLIVLNGTREMANIRLQSVDDEIKDTIDKLGNVRGGKTYRPARDEEGAGRPVSEMTDKELMELLGAENQ